MDDSILDNIHSYNYSYNYELSSNSKNSTAEEWIMPSNQTFVDTYFSEIVPNDDHQSVSDFDGFESVSTNNFQSIQSVPDFDGFEPPLASTNNLSQALGAIASVGLPDSTLCNNITEPTWFEPEQHRPTEEPIADTTQHAVISLGDISISWTIGETNQRRDLLICRPLCHSYTRNKAIKAGYTWVCSQREHGCNHRIWTNGEYKTNLQILKVMGQHSVNCIPKPNNDIIRKYKFDCHDLGLRPENLFTPAHKIIEDQKLIYFKGHSITEHIPSNRYLADQMNYKRRSIRPVPPKPNDLFFTIKEDAFPKDFYLGEVVVGPESDKRRHFMFSTPRQRELLCSAKQLKIDATFKICSKPHTQLLTVHANIKTTTNERNMPLYYILMSGKREMDYTSVFEALKNNVEDNGTKKMQVETVLLDFELGLWGGARKIFGQTNNPDFRVRGCWFHYTQCIMKVVRDLKLEKDFYAKQDIYKMVRRLMCMALVDWKNITPLFYYYKKRYAQQIRENHSVEKLFNYVESQWILNTKITPRHWTCYRESIRTNNQVESYNGILWKASGQHKLHIYLLSMLLHKEAMRLIGLLDFPASVYTKKFQIHTEKQINEHYKKYENHELGEQGSSARILCDLLMQATRRIASWNARELTNMPDLDS